MNLVVIKRLFLAATLGSISGFAMAQAGTTMPAPTGTVPPAMTVPPAIDTAPPPPVRTPAPTAPPVSALPPTGMPIDTTEQRALGGCEAKPVADRETCRERVRAHFNAGHPTDTTMSDECTVLAGVARVDCIRSGNSGGE